MTDPTPTPSGDATMRAYAANLPVPEFESTAFTPLDKPLSRGAGRDRDLGGTAPAGPGSVQLRPTPASGQSTVPIATW